MKFLQRFRSYKYWCRPSWFSFVNPVCLLTIWLSESVNNLIIFDSLLEPLTGSQIRSQNYLALYHTLSIFGRSLGPPASYNPRCPHGSSKVHHLTTQKLLDRFVNLFKMADVLKTLQCLFCCVFVTKYIITITNLITMSLEYLLKRKFCCLREDK